MNTYCTYLRVSTQRQGAQGLGISAQRAMCDNFIKQNNGKHVQEFMDVESGTHRDRKGLWQAIEYCKKNGCSLVIAKLDRMSRDVEFTFKVINTGIDIHFTDMPVVNSMILGVFAAVAQYEREMVSTRTKQALAAKKARGEKMGAASEKYKANKASKTKDQLKEEDAKKGETKRQRYHGSRDVKMFLMVLKNTFPNATKGDEPSKWNWGMVNTKGNNKGIILSRMKEYTALNSELFQGWNFSDERAATIKLRGYIDTLKKSFNKTL